MWVTTGPGKAVGIVAVLIAGSAIAEQPLHNSTVSQSTPGLTAHLSEQLDFRAGALENAHHGASFSPAAGEDLTDGVGAGALLDWRFDTQGLRITGGALRETGADERTTTMLGQHREPQQLFNGDANWRPYLGLGWDSASGRRERLDIQLDMGIIFQSLEGAHGGGDTGQASLLEREAFLHREFESFDYQPTISADVEYRF
jgi:hypothetical protein